jgi:hypothetical protein
MITPSYALTATERVLPRLTLDFTTAVLDPRITFTRSGNTATVVNSSGFVVGVNADIPRFDYNPVGLACNGLLIEEQRSNLAIYSEIFANANWSKSASSISSDATTAPSNTLTADKFVENNTNASHELAQTVTGLSAVVHTFSVFAKAGERSILQLTFSGNGGSAFANFNVSTGQITNSGNGAVANIVNYGNGWYRCVMSSANAFTVGSCTVVQMLQTSPTAGRYASYQGNGTSGLNIWGAQLEAGAFATSYIPTVASQVTRTADIATMTGTNFSSWYSAGAGGVVIRALPSTVSGTRPVFQFDDNTANEIIALRGNTTNPELNIVDNGTSQAQIDAGTIAANTIYNLGAAWTTNNCAASVNGGVSVTDTTAIIPTVTQARLGSDGTNYLNGQLQTVRYWPQRIINAEVQAFSR